MPQAHTTYVTCTLPLLLRDLATQLSAQKQEESAALCSELMPQDFAAPPRPLPALLYTAVHISAHQCSAEQCSAKAELMALGH